MSNLDTYRLEFNEDQQAFHHEYAHNGHKPDTYGWKTVKEKCNDDFMWLLDKYVLAMKNQNTSSPYCEVSGNFKLTFKEVERYAKTLEAFLEGVNSGNRKLSELNPI